MPWHVAKGHGCPPSKPYAVVKTDTGEKVSCHVTKAKAQAQVKLLYSKEPSMSEANADCGGCADCGQHQDGIRAVDNSTWDGSAAMSSCAGSQTPASCYQSICAGRKSGDPALQSSWALPHHKSAGGPPNAAGVRAALSRLSSTQGLTNTEAARRHLEAHMSAISGSQSKAAPPRDNLFRMVRPGIELRQGTGDGWQPHLFGHFAVFNQWAEINSIFEGNFLERIAAGSFTKTIAEQRDSMRVLFQHGRDPQIGDKPLGPIEQLEEDNTGPAYDVPLLDTQYNRELLPGLKAGLYGASFRFRVVREEFNREPGPSDYNPDGLPERTIKEASVSEFGPVTFPAYEGASAGVRSITDEILMLAYTREPDRLRDLISTIPVPAHAPPDGAELRLTPAGRREPQKRPLVVIRNPNRERRSG